MPCGCLRGSADERKVLVDYARIDDVAELGQPAFRAMVQLHRVECFRLVELCFGKHEVADRLRSDVESRDCYSSADLASDGFRLVAVLASGERLFSRRRGRIGNSHLESVKYV